MHFPTFIAATCATLAAATQPSTYSNTNTNSYPKSSNTNLTPGSFSITNFVFGCTVNCSYNFDLAVTGSAENHPAVKKPVKCSGNLDSTTDYVECGYVSKTQKLYAYIVKDTNQLKLQYEVQRPKNSAVYKYYGEREVYAATGPNAGKQEKEFVVKESLSTGVA